MSLHTKASLVASFSTSSSSSSMSMDEPVPTLLIPRQSGALCAMCRCLADEDDHARYSYLEKQIKISAARGCALCRTLFESLLCSFSTASSTKGSLELFREDGMIKAVDFNNTTHYYELVDMDTTMTRSPYRPVAADSRLDICWALAEAWLATCISTHRTCSDGPDPSWPTRLLDVQDLRLVEGKACRGNVRYVTLSYVWGSSNFTKLEAHSLSSFQTGIDLHTLPKTVQDAIYATKRLRVRYLWVDALCIMQDSMNEWSREALQMGKYYGDALVNLSALDSHHANAGFLGARQPEANTNLQNGLHLRAAKRPWAAIFKHAPLAKRAWILQERLIARRVIHFSESELFWECQAASARESSSIVHYGDFNQTWKDENFKKTFALDALVAENADKSTERRNDLVMTQWYRILEQYSNLNLTMAHDVFVALSAIAQKFQQITEFTYVAGLWWENVHRGLLWFATNALSKREYRHTAPSWSWASHGGPVATLFPYAASVRIKARAEMVHYRCTPDYGGDLLLGAREATLGLRADGIKVWCRSSSDGHAPYSDPYLRMSVDVFDEDGIFIGTGRLDTVPDQSPFTCTALIICDDNNSHNTTDPDITYFLLVQVKKEDAKNVSTRIGVGYTIDSTHGHPGKAFKTHQKELFSLI